MKQRLLKPFLALVLPVLLGAAAVSTQAQISSIETIPRTTIGPSLPPFDLWSPNVYDPFHPKKLTFEGGIVSIGQPGPGVLFWFDWLDSQGQPVMSQPKHLQPGPVFEEYWIPFCPQQVSIHFSLDPQSPTTGEAYEIQGVFTHECIIPEPSEYAALAGLGLIGFTVFRRWHGATRG